MNTNIDKIKNNLLVKYPFFGSIVANLEYQETRKCVDFHKNPTAGTDGKVIYYHPDFINSLSSDEQVFVFAHEVCHVAFDHIIRSEGKDKKLWNIATDAVINAFLKQDGLKLTDGVVDIEDAINYNAEEMYEKLLEQKNNNQDKDKSVNNIQRSTNSKSETNNNENYDVDHDTHSIWEKGLEDSKKQNQTSQNENEESGNKREKDKQDAKQQYMNDEKRLKKEKKLEEHIKKISEIGVKKVFKQNKIMRDKQLDELLSSLAKESIGFGNNTNMEIRKIESIGVANALVDWRRLLKENVNIEVDWSYQDASIEQGVVTPHLEEYATSETEILLDTSGSIDESLLRNFLRECKNILQTSKLKVGCFDTEFYGFNDIRNINDIDNMEFLGGGGTNFDVAVNAFTPRVENKIIFTDGESSMPQKKVDAIWLVFGNRKINPPGGRVIYIPEEQLHKLYVSNCNINESHKTK